MEGTSTMSAVVIVPKSVCVEVLTDFAHVAGTDNPEDAIKCDLVSLTGKQAWTNEPFPIVFSVTGWAGPMAAFAQLLFPYTDPASIVRDMGDLWREAITSCGGPKQGIPCVLHLAVARRGQPQAFSVCDTDIEGMPAFVRGKIVNPIAEGALRASDEFMDRFEGRADAFDANRDGVAVMQAMRSEGHLPIGGGVQWTRLGRDSVTSEVIHRWPDEIGRPISLEAA